MKKLLPLIFIFASFNLLAQKSILLLKTGSSIKPDIEKVARDYYDHFYNIKGDTISESESTIEYQSKVIPASSIESSITQIKSLHNVYSWQATLLNTDDYEKAVEKYKQIFHQLNGSNFKIQDNQTWKFEGPYDTPNDARSFASSILEPTVNDKVFKRLKIEIALNYNMPDWTVKVMVYEKEKDADIRPSEKNSNY